MAIDKDVQMKDAADTAKGKPKAAANKKKMKNGKPVVEEEELSEEDLELKSRLELFVERAKESDSGVQARALPMTHICSPLFGRVPHQHCGLDGAGCSPGRHWQRDPGSNHINDLRPKALEVSAQALCRTGGVLQGP